MKKRNPKAIVRGMRVLVVVHLVAKKRWTFSTANSPPVNAVAAMPQTATILPLRLVQCPQRFAMWTAVNKQGDVLADITPEDEGITWVRGWTKDTEHARALYAAVSLS